MSNKFTDLFGGFENERMQEAFVDCEIKNVKISMEKIKHLYSYKVSNSKFFGYDLVFPFLDYCCIRKNCIKKECKLQEKYIF